MDLNLNQEKHFALRNSLLFIIVSTLAVGKELITPIPLQPVYNLEKAKLGKKLFFETRLSKDNTISCGTCHNLYDGGDDNLKFSFGINGQKGSLNSPTVLNSVYNFRQFWNGRARTLQEQAKEPIENPVEMGYDLTEVVKVLKKDSNYEKYFSKAYSNGVTEDNIVDAIAEFEKTLITPNSPFDKYLRGEKKAITEDEKQGYLLFNTKGCISCHNGVNVGGTLYSKLGMINNTDSRYKGLFELTNDKEDEYFFKVPTLRNIEKTAPYFHDGRAETLEEAVNIMADKQLGIHLSKKEVKQIIEFLHTLSGELTIIDE
ncbi:MAG: cytochrome-c peroxidase [Campylobacterales bacterium]|nr:cytochrome-c peroxidase [Campylobacterales bacterium]